VSEQDTEQRRTEHVAAEEEVEERRTGVAGLAVLVGLVVLLGIRGSWSMVVIALALVVMIFLHELGHYLTAKWAGMKVTEFFIGFGPRLWSFQRGETEYGIKAIPAGAYVKVIGMSNLDEVDPADEERTYRAKPYWRRLSVAVAGSTMHFILAFALIVTVFVGYGVPDDETKWSLGSVSGPALDAGLQPGDRIVSIDGSRIDTFEDMSLYVKGHPGQEVAVDVLRGGAERTIDVTLGREHPQTGAKVGFLGVAPDHDAVKRGLLEGIGEGVGEMGTMAKESVAGLGRLFSPSGFSNYLDNFTGDDEVAGSGAGEAIAEDRPSSVIGIVQVGGQAAERGFDRVLYLLFAVNMFIGIFNLTPLLPFDGGHVVIATYEKIRSMISGHRYQADVAKLLPLTYAVVMVLALLFVTTIYLDIADPIDL
jgi:membrane-associated protease RseP (regulator of RpoE activity)